MEMVEDVVIVGGGIAGLASALALKRVGLKALVLEKSDSLRATGAALTLLPNAWLALDALGVSHKLTSVYPIIQKSYVTNLTTNQISFTRNTKAERRAVHRKALMMAMAEELESDSIRFSCKITSIHSDVFEGSSIAVVCMENGTVIKAKILIGCDGVHSVVSKWLGLAEPVHSGKVAVRGLSVFPQGHGLEHDFMSYIGDGPRAGFVPLNKTQIYWFYVIATPTKGAYSSRDAEEIVKEVIEKNDAYFPPTFLDIMRKTDWSTLTWAPLMLRRPWRLAFGTISRGCVTVCGDAMHPMTPDIAQGGCSTLEDAVVLGRHLGACLRRTTDGVIKAEAAANALADYANERRWRATWLIAFSSLAGWVQLSGSFWGLKIFRDFVYYKYLAKKIFNFSQNYDCGKLVD